MAISLIRHPLLLTLFSNWVGKFSSTVLEPTVSTWGFPIYIFLKPRRRFKEVGNGQVILSWKKLHMSRPTINQWKVILDGNKKPADHWAMVMPDTTVFL